jgi:transporter family protein
MNSSIILALCAMLCFGLSDLVYKRAAAAGVAPHQLMTVQSWLYGLMVLIYGYATGGLVFNTYALWGVLAGLFAFTGFYNFARSLAGGAVSVNATIFRLSFTLTAALAVLLLGEPLGPGKLLGLGCALVAVWLLLGGARAPVPGTGNARAETGNGTSTQSRPGTRASLERVLVATLSIAVANLIYKVGLMQGSTPVPMLLAQAAVVMTASSAFTLRIEGRIYFTHSAFAHACVTALLLSAGFIFLFEGLARGEASRLVPIAQMGFVVTALVGFVFLREPYNARKGLGLAFALAALAGLTLA